MTTERTPVLIGVGGTGQTVLASYLRLANMAGIKPARFYVVDSDTKGPLGSKLTQLQGSVEELADGSKVPQRWMVNPFPIADSDRSTFGSLFGNMVGPRRRLFDALFSEEAEQTPIRTGMYGRPAIGATCIRYKILQDDDDLKELKDGLRGGAKHVVLVGSCFGGTGSGGVPMLASEFARLNEQPGFDLLVDAVIFLPWFQLILGEGEMRKDDKSLHEHLNRNFEPNAAAGIHYFKRELREHVESLVLLGMPDPTRNPRVSNEKSQQETVHPLNLLAAILIHNRFSGTLHAPRGIAGYWIDGDKGIAPKELEVARNGSGALTVQKVAQRAFLAQDWLGILSRFFNNFTRIPTLHQPLLIRVALEQIGGSTQSLDEVASTVGEILGRRRALSGDGLEWLRRMVEEDSSLLPLEEEDLTIRSDTYDETRAHPLREIDDWSRDERTVARFQPIHMRSTATFADRFSDEFLSHLIDRFQL